MNPVSVREYHGLRVGSALLSIVAGCIIIGVSRECDADAVGGIFLGAGGLDTLWLLNSTGNFRVHPMATNPAPDQPAETLAREGTQIQLEPSKSRMGTFVGGGPVAGPNPEEGTSSDMPDVLSRRKLKQSPTEQDPP
ncbi:kinocilin isoform X3 [Cololabis saira]|uniref:kinocilin isoform X3 n=1 Tax=Cololabis saira TaxID=129043 RepID=UPI002AD4E9B4|nr:kinocilin isoform X3 [Cololabis saira]